MEIELIDIQELEKAYGDVNPYSEEGFEITKKWLSETNTTLYEAPAEDFSMIAAYRKAREDGNCRLIVNNLS